MTEKEFERLEKARDIKGKIETCDGIIEDINAGDLLMTMRVCHQSPKTFLMTSQNVRRKN